MYKIGVELNYILAAADKQRKETPDCASDCEHCTFATSLIDNDKWNDGFIIGIHASRKELKN